MKKPPECSPGLRFHTNAGNLVYVAAAIALTMLLQVCAGIYRPPRGALPVETAATWERDGEISRTGIPFLESCTDNPSFVPGVYTIHLRLKVPESVLQAGQNVLIFPQIAGSSLTVYLNGLMLGQRGDPVSGRSTIWNSAHIFPVPAEASSRTIRSTRKSWAPMRRASR